MDSQHSNFDAEQQKHRRDVRNGLAIFLVLAMTLSRSVQIFSRKLGTSSVFGMVGSVLSVLIFGWYYTEREMLVGPDRIHIFNAAGAYFCWLGWDILLYFDRLFRGKSRNGNPMGEGLFSTSTDPSPQRDFYTDLAVAVLLFLLFHFNESPIQAGWFKGMAFWLLFCHGWTVGHQRLANHQRQQAAVRAAEWSAQLRGGKAIR